MCERYGSELRTATAELMRNAMPAMRAMWDNFWEHKCVIFDPSGPRDTFVDPIMSLATHCYDIPVHLTGYATRVSIISMRR